MANTLRLHAIPSRLLAQTKLSKPMKNKHKILIIGGNFAGISAAKRLSTLNNRDIEFTVVDSADHFNWTPNIHEILSGVKDKQGVQISREKLVTSLGGNFVKGRVTALDLDNKFAELDSGVSLNFDACLLACGYAPKALPSSENGFYFRNAQDVLQISEKITHKLAQPETIKLTIVGGGFTGVEALGELLRHYGKNTHLNITLIESGPRLVKDLPQVISDNILKLTAAHQVDFKFDCRVTDISDNQLSLSDGSHLVSDINIWTTGGSLPDFLVNSGLAEASDSGVSVNVMLQSLSNPACFVAGDVVSLPLGDDKNLSKQSYHAQDMGSRAAENMLNWLKNKHQLDFQPVEKPILLSFGDINTYMVSGDSVLASPTLAASKEAIYQIGMHKLISSMSLFSQKQSAVSHFIRATSKLLLPELRPSTPFKILQRSCLLQYGNPKDLKILMASVGSLLTD